MISKSWNVSNIWGLHINDFRYVTVVFLHLFSMIIAANFVILHRDINLLVREWG